MNDAKLPQDVIEAINYASTCTVPSVNWDTAMLELVMRRIRGKANPAAVLKEIRSRYP